MSFVTRIFDVWNVVGWIFVIWITVSGVENIGDSMAGFGDVNVYRKTCRNMDQDAFECTKENGGYRIGKTTYRVDFKNQRVITKDTLMSGIIYGKQDCIVFDKENWTCRYGSDGFSTMTGGLFSSSSESEHKNNKIFFYYAPSFAVDYWLEYLRGFF